MITSQSSITSIKLERAEQEKKWLDGNGRLLRDFASFKDLYAVSPVNLFFVVFSSLMFFLV